MRLRYRQSLRAQSTHPLFDIQEAQGAWASVKGKLAQATFGDFTGDGKGTDLLLLRAKHVQDQATVALRSEAQLWLSSGCGKQLKEQNPSVSRFGLPKGVVAPVAVDVDGDGLSDLAAFVWDTTKAGDAGSIKFFRNTATKGASGTVAFTEFGWTAGLQLKAHHMCFTGDTLDCSAERGSPVLSAGGAPGSVGGAAYEFSPRFAMGPVGEVEEQQ